MEVVVLFGGWSRNELSIDGAFCGSFRVVYERQVFLIQDLLIEAIAYGSVLEGGLLVSEGGLSSDEVDQGQVDS